MEKQAGEFQLHPALLVLVLLLGVASTTLTTVWFLSHSQYYAWPM